MTADFGRFSLLEAGLIAGGVDRDEELKTYHRRFDSLAEELRSSGKVRGSPHEQARAVFEYLHREAAHGRVLPAGKRLAASL